MYDILYIICIIYIYIIDSVKIFGELLAVASHYLKLIGDTKLNKIIYDIQLPRYL